MIKETIVYKDFNDNELIEDFYFNLTKDEIILFGTNPDGLINLTTIEESGSDLQALINKISQETDVKKVYTYLRDIVLTSYGEKSEDGRRFIKSEEKTKAFEESNAFSELIMSLLVNGEKAAHFIDGILPSDLRDEVDKEMNNVVSNNS